MSVIGPDFISFRSAILKALLNFINTILDSSVHRRARLMRWFLTPSLLHLHFVTSCRESSSVRGLSLDLVLRYGSMPRIRKSFTINSQQQASKLHPHPSTAPSDVPLPLLIRTVT